MGRMGICLRRRHRSMEVAGEVQLPDGRRDYSDSRGGRVLRRLGGNFYAFDVANGKKLWGQKIGGAIAGGVITYTAGGAQRVAVATGLANVTLPTEVATAKIIVLGLDGEPAKP